MRAAGSGGKNAPFGKIAVQERRGVKKRRFTRVKRRAVCKTVLVFRTW